MKYKCADGCWVISSHGCWRPGTYESEKAANMAIRKSDEALTELQKKANERMPHWVGGTITEQDLKGITK